MVSVPSPDELVFLAQSLSCVIPLSNDYAHTSLPPFLTLRTRVLVAEEIAATVEREGPRIYGSSAARTTTATSGGGGGDLLPQIARLVRRTLQQRGGGR